MNVELADLSDYTVDCLNEAVGLAYATGIAITHIAVIIEDFCDIKLPKEEEVVTILKEAEAALPVVRAFLRATEELRESGLSLAAFAATVDAYASRYMCVAFEAYQKATDFYRVTALEAPVNPRHQLIAAMMARAFNIWLDYSEVPADFSFVEMADDVVPKPGSTIAFIMEAIGQVHEISLDEYRAALPHMERMVGKHLLVPWESQAAIGSEPA